MESGRRQKQGTEAEKIDVASHLGLNLSLNLDKVGGNSVTPPELTRDAPIPRVLQPAVPSRFMHLGHNIQLSFPNSLQGNNLGGQQGNNGGRRGNRKVSK